MELEHRLELEHDPPGLSCSHTMRRGGHPQGQPLFQSASRMRKQARLIRRGLYVSRTAFMEASRTASVRQYNLRSDPSESCAGKRKPGAGTRLPLLDYLCYYYTITIPAYSLGTFSWLPYQQKGCPEEFSRAYRVFPSLVDKTHSLLLLMLLSHSFEQPSRPCLITDKRYTFLPQLFLYFP